MDRLHDGEWVPDAIRDQYDHDAFEAWIGPDADWTAPQNRARLAGANGDAA